MENALKRHKGTAKRFNFKKVALLQGADYKETILNGISDLSMKHKLSKCPDHLRLSEETKRIVREEGAMTVRGVEEQMRYFLLLGIHYQRILNGEVSRAKKFNPEDYS